jgi:magnesium chelatase family protein
MVAKIQTTIFQGIDIAPIDVQVQAANGIPGVHIVGLPDKAVTESRERVRSALYAIGLSLPAKKITINLSPADLQKEGSHFDLPITLALLAAINVLDKELIANAIAVGELELDGSIRPVLGVLPIAMHAFKNNKKLVCPLDNAAEAKWIEGVEIQSAPTLTSLIQTLKGEKSILAPLPQLGTQKHSRLDFTEVKGQKLAKRALEIAAAGGHNVLLNGPPGAGKSMLAERMISILPPLSPQESLEISSIHSISGNLKQGQLLHERPFRNPHHSASKVALIGGGIKVRPGEISLAHHGVLFMDEFPEYSRDTLESLRQPIESGQAVIARANAHITFPAKFQLIAAMNPCKCGYFNTPQAQCPPHRNCAQSYQQRLSGPILDRIDLHLTVDRVTPHALSSLDGGESSQKIAERVKQARQKQTERYRGLPYETNVRISNRYIEEESILSKPAKDLLNQASERFHLSARTYYRSIKVALTIADLAQSPNINEDHMAEALMFRGAF